jgi:hypothetical protein
VDARSSCQPGHGRSILVIGYDEMTEVTERALNTAGAKVTYLRDPHDRAIRRALDGEVDAVVVISNDDHVSLRLALVVENVRPGVPLVVTVFGGIVASQLQRAVRNVRVMSMSDMVVLSLAGPCLDDRLLSVSRRDGGFAGVQAGPDGPQLVPIEPYVPSRGQWLLTNLASILNPFELSARILMAGLLGLPFILLLETAVVATALDEPIIDALYLATKTIVTVGPNPLIDDGPRWLKVFSALAMLAALGFTALFTAGVVNRLLADRAVRQRRRGGSRRPGGGDRARRPGPVDRHRGWLTDLLRLGAVAGRLCLPARRRLTEAGGGPSRTRLFVSGALPGRRLPRRALGRSGSCHTRRPGARAAAAVDRAARAQRSRGVRAAARRPPARARRYIAQQLEQIGATAAGPPPRVRRWLPAELSMGRRPWPVPELASVGAVASHLEVSDGQLAWLADVRELERTVAAEKLRHYRYAWLPRHGGPPRIIERPKARLKSVQRRVLHEVLDWIPAHDAAHGFTRGRSARSNAAAHTRRRVVMRLDLEDFFASVSAPRGYGIFRTAGYPEPVAHTLTALSTNAVPVEQWAAVPRPTAPTLIQAHHRLGRRLAVPHLPQGAPTSPALANLAAFTLDRRLAGLAAALDATYTRYADDLTFSGSSRLLHQGERIRDTIATIAREEGFAVNNRKSVVTARAGRQRVCGIVVNEGPNVTRHEYDQLKAILHNAARRGPSGENRGRVRLPRPPPRAHRLDRVAPPRPGREAAQRVRAHRLGARLR